MTQPVVQLGRSDVWGQIFSQAFQSIGFTGRRPIPIRPYIIPASLTSHILAVHCTSLNEDEAGKWQRGCKVTQLISIGRSIAGQNLVAAETRIIGQGLPTLLRLKRYSDEYFIRLDFYPWFSNLFVELWEYRGIDSDTNTEALLSIESSVNQLIQRNP